MPLGVAVAAPSPSKGRLPRVVRWRRPAWARRSRVSAMCRSMTSRWRGASGSPFPGPAISRCRASSSGRQRSASRSTTTRTTECSPSSGYSSSQRTRAAPSRSRARRANVWARSVGTGAAGGGTPGPRVPTSWCKRSRKACLPPPKAIASRSPLRSSTPSASACLLASVPSMRCSMVPSETRWMTVTGRVWCLRQARAMRCSSRAGFQGRSQLMTTLAF